MSYHHDQARRDPESREQSPPPPYSLTLSSESSIPATAYRPPLPPRSSGVMQAETPSDSPPLYYSQPLTSSWTAQDPRNTSTESLVPRKSDSEKRTLLLIYVHGFLGNETSFQSFPAHVHNLTTHLLKETHIVHTKIYPRYKSRKAINFARDDFSKWLRPHESSETDIVLLGHSMGGIVSADVVLLPSRQTQESFAHRILGTINFDTPFLGMHPGVVVSGISSLFRPADATPQPQLHDGSSQALLPAPDGDYFLGESQSNGSMIHQDDPSEYSKPGSFSGISPSPSAASKSIGSPLSGLSIPISDPNYNPPFENDVVLPVRKGWDNALHFVMKHSDDLSKATKEYVTSHLKFGGTMADYKGLQARYRQIRALEDVNDSRLSHRRVRFLNYYTASTGRIRKPKPLPPTIDRQAVSTIDSEAAKELDDTQDLSPSRISPASSPDPTHESLQISQRERSNSASSNQDLGHIDPIPMPDNDRLDDSGNEEPDDDMPALKEELTGSQVPLKLPPIPPEPETPEDFKPDAYEDKDIRKLAEKEYARKMKAYLRGVRDREKAISDRQKMIEKREKKARKAQEKSLKDEKKLQAKEEKERKKQLAVEEKEAAAGTVTHVLAESTKAIDEGADSADISATRREDAGKGKAKRERKFCMLPSKDDNGQRDPAWIRVFMEGVDEVGAHCGLFFADRPHYAQFVTDVSEKLKEWVERDKMVRDER